MNEQVINWDKAVKTDIQSNITNIGVYESSVNTYQELVTQYIKYNRVIILETRQIKLVVCFPCFEESCISTALLLQ